MKVAILIIGVYCLQGANCVESIIQKYLTPQLGDTLKEIAVKRYLSNYYQDALAKYKNLKANEQDEELICKLAELGTKSIDDDIVRLIKTYFQKIIFTFVGKTAK